MRLLADYHTHTTFSHGKGSIEDNVKVAIQKGLKEIAITDHGLAHSLFGINLKKLKIMKEQINELKVKYPQINILLGVEANLISHNGDIDVNNKLLEYVDIVIVGFHKTARPQNIGAFLKFYLPNWLKIKSKKQIKVNTNAYLQMLEKYNYITCITHLNYGCKVNVEDVAKACKTHNVYVELNGKRTLFTKQEINKMLNLNVNFLINSDAHTPQNVGNTTIPTNFALKYKIPQNNVSNWNNTAKIKQITQKDNL